MRKMGILLGLLLLLSSCGTPRPQGETAGPQREETQAKLEFLDLAKELRLRETQTYQVFEYSGGQILAGISDEARTGPVQHWNDSVTLPYFEEFVLYDVEKQAVAAEFPVGQFADCPSAVCAFDGILAAMVVTTGIDESETAFFQIDSQGMRPVYQQKEGIYWIFDSQLQRCGDGVLFSYFDFEENTFGVKQLDGAWNVEPVLTFSRERYESCGDTIVSSQGLCGYAVQEGDQVAIYRWSAGQEPVPIRLPKGVKIFGYAFAEDSLLVSQRTDTGESGYYLERLDWDGHSLERVRLKEPLHGITANAASQVFGACPQVVQEEPALLFETAPSIRPLPVEAGAAV